MSFGVKSVDRLSLITIDQDKDWNAMSVTNLKELVAGMGKGDILASDGTNLVRVPASFIGFELATHGNVSPPSFDAPPPAP